MCHLIAFQSQSSMLTLDPYLITRALSRLTDDEYIWATVTFVSLVTGLLIGILIGLYHGFKQGERGGHKTGYRRGRMSGYSPRVRWQLPFAFVADHPKQTIVLGIYHRPNDTGQGRYISLLHCFNGGTRGNAVFVHEKHGEVFPDWVANVDFGPEKPRKRRLRPS